MTIANTPRKAGPFDGNGATVTFPFAFKVFAASNLLVVLSDSDGVETTQTLTTDYTVTLNTDQDDDPGGDVVMVTAPAAGETLTLSSALPIEQPTELTNAGGFYPSVINNALDRITIVQQQEAEKLSRALKTSISSPLIESDLPTPIPSYIIGWNAEGTGFENYGPVDNTLLSAELEASGGAALVGYLPAGTGAVETTVQSKLSETVSVFDFMTKAQIADVQARTRLIDVTVPIQAAIDDWLLGDTPKTLVFPSGRYKVTSTLLCSPVQNTVQQKVLFGYGATIDSYVGATCLKCTTLVSNKLWANAVIEGLTISGGVNSFSFEAGGPSTADWMWNFTLKNLNATNFSGNGFYCYDGIFESAFYSCIAWGNPSNVTGYGYLFENGPLSVISSIDIYNANTRYCKNGVRTIHPIADVDIFGGTFLLAQEEGIRFELCQGSIITGVHVEENWQAGGGTVRAGIRINGFASLNGIYAQSSNALHQNYGVQIYSYGPTFVASGSVGGAGHTAFGYYDTGNRTEDVIYSMGVSHTDTATSKISDAINGVYTPTITGVANVASSSAVACQYAKNGKSVTVSGYVSIAATAASGTLTSLRISLPFASNFASGNQCAGTVSHVNPTPATSTFGVIIGDATNNEALMQYNANASGGALTMYFHFTYRII